MQQQRFRNFFIVFLHLLTIFAVFINSEKVNNSVCSSAPRCSFEENLFWALDGEHCKVFTNYCLFLTEYCGGNLDLKSVPREDCQKNCRRPCPRILRYVCASYNDEYRTFTNECEMQVQSCEKAKPYSLYRYGRCEDDYAVNKCV